MANKKFNVTNKKNRTVQRLNYTFKPNQTQTIEIPEGDVLALKAARGLEVEEASADAEVQTRTIKEDMDLVRDSNIDEVMQLIEDGYMEASEALQYEKEGKNRQTLIKQLEDVAWEIQKEENKGNYHLESEKEVTSTQATNEAESDDNEG